MFLDTTFIVAYAYSQTFVNPSTPFVEHKTKEDFERSDKFEPNTQYIIKVDDFGHGCVYKVNAQLDKMLPFLHKKYITSYVYYSNTDYHESVRKFTNDKRYNQRYMYVCLHDAHDKTFDIYEVY